MLQTPEMMQAPSDWLTSAEEGRLALDIFRDGDALVIRSTIAGVDPEHLDVAIHGDLLTIRGERLSPPAVNADDLFYQECYWGAFSRSVVLPYDVFPERAQASLKNGVLEIRLPVRSSEYRLRVGE